jgi:purine-binding chemotaxis protein CheW
MNVLVLPVDDELYAVPLSAVREVEPMPGLAPLPTAPEAVLGLINVRGEIVPMFDVARLVGERKTARHSFAVVVEVAAGVAALSTSDTPLSEPLGERVADSDRPAGRGIHRQGGRLATLLDLEALLARN